MITSRRDPDIPTPAPEINRTELAALEKRATAIGLTVTRDPGSGRYLLVNRAHSWLIESGLWDIRGVDEALERRERAVDAVARR